MSRDEFEDYQYDRSDRVECPTGTPPKTGKSDLRKSSCPTCGKSNKLTQDDVDNGSQCDECELGW